MITTRILTDDEPLKAVLKGAETLYKAVSTTMGPRGRNVVFRKYGKRVGVTHDGVTVAKMVKINNEAEDVGADLLREAAMKLDSVTGDGTTTVTVLAYHILKGAAEQIEKGESAMKLKLSIEALQPEILAWIDKHTDKDVTKDKIIQIATVASGDKDIGKAVGEAVFEAGKDTPIMLGFSESSETHTDVIKGFKINSGPASPYLMEGAGVKHSIESPMIAVVVAVLRDKEDVLPILKMLAVQEPDKRKLLLVCDEIAGDALSLMVVNRLKGLADIAVARVPEYIQGKSEYLSDVATSCGAQVLSRNSGNTIREPKEEHFGSARSVTVEPLETIIVEGYGVEEYIKLKIEELTEFREGSKSKAARDFADGRIKTLDQKIVSIHVGGQSETEAEERHYRFEDAVGASQAALRGGIVPGGGTLLDGIGTVLMGTDRVAEDILGLALKAPMKKVLDNAGVDYPIGIVAGIYPGKGYDVMHPEDGVVDLVERGIIDPAESEIECIKTAISIAGLLMTSGAMVIDEGAPDAQIEQQTTIG